jgi:hypothetical protein
MTQVRASAEHAKERRKATPPIVSQGAPEGKAYAAGSVPGVPARG